MSTPHIFISHASDDDAFVKDLRIALEGLGLPIWVDSRKLRGGTKLAPEIREAIEQVHQVVERLNIERRLDSGGLPCTLRAAQVLLQRCQAAGEMAYEGADYDLTMLKG